MQATLFDDVHSFWFGPLPDFATFPDRMPIWFGGAGDAEIGARFSDVLQQAAEEEIDVAALTPAQQTGLVVLLDQFPRSMFRNDKRSYAFDEKARAVVDVATANGMAPFKLAERAFLIICLGHSEKLADQERALRHFEEDSAPFAPAGNRFFEAGRIQTAKYLDIIRRFGRFPHRNPILGRETTAEEAAFLQTTSMSPF